MQQVTAYKTDDGDLFLSEDDAKSHEMTLSFESWWRDECPYDGLSRNDTDEAHRFFFENWLELKKFFSENHKPSAIPDDDETPF